MPLNLKTEHYWLTAYSQASQADIYTDSIKRMLPKVFHYLRSGENGKVF